MSHTSNILPSILVLLTAFIISSCESWLPNAHSPSITQGNAIKAEALEKIKPGMIKSEIKLIIGSPLLTDPFHAQRWDYVYRYIPGGRDSSPAIESRVTLFFDGDVLIKVDDSLYSEPKSDNEKHGDGIGVAPATGGGHSH